MISLKKLINFKPEKIKEIGHPEPKFEPLKIDPSRRDMLGYTVRVKYEKHTETRFFALKKATKKVKKREGNAMDAGVKRQQEAEKRAWEFCNKMHEKLARG